MSVDSISRFSSAPLPQAVAKPVAKPAAKLPEVEKVATVETKDLRGLLAAAPKAVVVDESKKDASSEKLAELLSGNLGLEKVGVVSRAAEPANDAAAVAPISGEEKQASTAEEAVKELINNAAARTADSAYKVTQGVSNGSKNGGGVGTLSLAV